MSFKRHLICTCIAIVSMWIALPSAWAQSDYPSRPIKLLVPFAPGGATDVLGRMLAMQLGEQLGQPVIVENKPGAGTVLAASIVAKAPADGYLLLLGSGTTFTLNPAIQTSLPYDPIRSFSPIGMIADMDLVLVTNPGTGFATLKDVITRAKSQPELFSYGSFGPGTSSHFGGELLKQAAGIHMVHVPFNGSAPSLTALMGNQMPVAVDTSVATVPLIKGDKIRPIAVLSKQRLAQLPHVPTIAESGFPDFEMNTWFGLVAPAHLPPAVQEKLERALAAVSGSPGMTQKLIDIGLTPAYGNGTELNKRIARELPKMRALAQRADIKAN